MKIYNGYKRLARDYTLATDEYEYTMAYGFLKTGKAKQEAVFDVFFRKIPGNGGYAIMAGVDKVIEFVKNINYGKRNIEYFERNNYPKEFIESLKKIKFTGDIYAVPDGTPVFPNEPIITIKGPLSEVQLLETAILAIVNGAMLTATGARKIIEAVPKGVELYDFPNENNNRFKHTPGVTDFGLRRAPGIEAGIDSSLYGIMAGCVGTSNVLAADMLNMKAMGTMAHSWIEAFPNEFEAFKSFAKIYPDKCILLVDTYDTLRSGVPNAIKTFKWMKEQGLNTNNIGIRIDSGDLAYLTKQARNMMDKAGFPQATICISNGLDNEKIESLIQQGAIFNSLGVGDNISKPEGNMGNVYKEVAINENGIWIPKIKLSNDTIKITNPGFKKLYRAYDKNTGYALADIIAIKDEKLNKNNITIVSPTDPLKRTTISNYELIELQQPIFLNGELVYEDKDIKEIQNYCNEEMKKIYPEIKRRINPHEYYVDGTEDYINLKIETIKKTRKLIK